MYGKVLVHLGRRSEYRPAEFHASLNNTRSIIANDPIDRLTSESFCSRRRRVLEGNLVEAEP